MAETPRAWLRSEASFPMQDPISGTRFEPNTPVKADLTNWVLNQPTIVRITDPNDNAPSTKDLQKVDELNAQDEAERVAREETAERAQRKANGQAQIAESIAQAKAEAAAPAGDKKEA